MPAESTARLRPSTLAFTRYRRGARVGLAPSPSRLKAYEKVWAEHRPEMRKQYEGLLTKFGKVHSIGSIGGDRGCPVARRLPWSRPRQLLPSAS